MKKIYQLIFLCIWFVPKISNSQCATATSVPYFEGFEGISSNNQLPTCWAASNPSVTCLTFTGGLSNSGSRAAGFYYSPAGTNYFYSNLIHLNAGVTYSAGIFYKVAPPGSGISWSNLRLSYGPNQSTVGLNSIALLSGNVVQTSYTSLSNTFVVSASGDYHLAIEATGNGTGSNNYLYFDDLFVTVPCNLGNNTPTVNFVAASNSICVGGTITYTLTGADTYSVNGIAVASPVATQVYTPNIAGPFGFQVVGTSTLTGCSASLNPVISVVPLPLVIPVSSQPTVCSGEPVVLTAAGNAGIYVWSVNQTTAQAVTVNPTVSTVYTVTGIGANVGAYDCQATGTVQVQVVPNPSFTITTNPQTDFCYGQPITLSVNSGLTYQWLTSEGEILGGTSIVVTLTTSTDYTVTGTDLNGCKNTEQISIPIDICDNGILQLGANASDYIIYPNPFSDRFTIKGGLSSLTKIELFDLSGRILNRFNKNQYELELNLSGLDKGIYFLRVSDENYSRVFEVVKAE